MRDIVDHALTSSLVRAISQQDHERIDELMALFEGIRRHFNTGENVHSVEGVSRIEMAISSIKEDTDILGEWLALSLIAPMNLKLI